MNRNITDSELFVAIQSSIANNTPLSYVRMGDCEIQIIKKILHCKTADELNIRAHALKHIALRYNEVYTEDNPLMLKWRQAIIDTFKSSDYCGIFTTQEIEEMMALGWLKEARKEATLGRYVPNRDVFDYYGIDVDKLKICSVMFNKGEQLGIIENFKQLVGDRRITIITNQTENLKKNSKFQINLGNQVDFITVKHEHGNPKSKAFNQKNWVRSHFKDIKSHLDSGIVQLMVSSLETAFDDIEKKRRAGGKQSQGIPKNVFDSFETDLRESWTRKQKRK